MKPGIVHFAHRLEVNRRDCRKQRRLDFSNQTFLPQPTGWQTAMDILQHTQGATIRTKHKNWRASKSLSRFCKRWLFIRRLLTGAKNPPFEPPTFATSHAFWTPQPAMSFTLFYTHLECFLTSLPQGLPHKKPPLLPSACSACFQAPLHGPSAWQR